MWPEPLNEPVKRALDELHERFGGLEIEPDGPGGARVTVQRVPLPAGLSRSESWVGFVIPHNYDDVQVYGHHFPRDLRRADGAELAPPGISYGGEWSGKPSLVVSRGSNNWRKGIDTALIKLLKVLGFLKTRADA